MCDGLLPRPPPTLLSKRALWHHGASACHPLSDLRLPALGLELQSCHRVLRQFHYTFTHSRAISDGDNTSCALLQVQDLALSHLNAPSGLDHILVRVGAGIPLLPLYFECEDRDASESRDSVW
jgi:hypothetical protein